MQTKERREIQHGSHHLINSKEALAAQPYNGEAKQNNADEKRSGREVTTRRCETTASRDRNTDPPVAIERERRAVSEFPSDTTT